MSVVRKSVRRFGPEGTTGLLCAAVVLGYVALTAWDIAKDRNHSLAEGERTARMAAAALSQHTVETFSEATSPIASMERLLAGAGGLARVSPQQAHVWLKALTPPHEPVDRLVLFDTRGWNYATTVRPSPPKPDSYVNHPGIAPHVKGQSQGTTLIELPLELPPETILLAPMTEPGSSRWIIPVTRTLRAKEGKPDAIMAALLRVDYFNKFYSILANHRDASITLLRDDGALLARHPFRADYQGAVFEEAIQLIGRAAGRAAFVRSPIDGIERLTVAHKVESLPLYMVVGLSADDVLQPWLERTIQRLIACAAFSIVVVVLSLLVIRGIRDRRRGEEAVRKLNMELEDRVRERTVELTRANRDMEAFSYSASHDLRAPIRRIGSFAEAIVVDHGVALPPDARRMLDRIRSSATQMGNLLSDILTLFHANQSNLKPVSLDIGLMTRAIVEQLAADDPKRLYELHVREEDMVAQADEGLMRLALTNLLSNAWKYSATTVYARIEVGRTNGAFYVRDNGAGFDMAHADKLFIAFSRLHSDAEFQGTGIGLAIVARVIERHGGQVRAEARLGHGATFYFTLP